MEFEERVQPAPWRWTALGAVLLLNIVLPNLVLSFGTLLVHSVSFGLPLWVGLCTPTIYVLTFQLSHSWCRDAADSWGGNTGYRALAFVGLSMVVIGLIACAYVPYEFYPLIYGILGGLGSSLILAQVDAVIFETYDTRLSLVRSLGYLGQAIGLAIFPHITTLLVDYYGYSMSHLVLSGIMLQALPVVLFLKVTEPVKRATSYSRYSDIAKNYARFNDPGINVYTNELQLHDLSKSWKSPDSISSEGDLDEYDIHSVDDVTHTITPPPSPEEKRRNMFGIDILPDIPEETESESSDQEVGMANHKKRLSVAIKRLSTLGDDFDECIEKQSRRDSNTETNSQSHEYTEIEVHYDNIAPMTELRREKVFNSFSFKCQSAYASLRRKMWMPSYRVYRCRRRMKYTWYVLIDTFIKPLSRSLSCWRFYPALILNTARLCFITITLAVFPLINIEMKPKKSMTETNFMISLLAFTWISFLLCTPWLVQNQKRNFKYILVLGLFIANAACYLVAESNNHDSFCIGCVVAGLGFGAITSCWETAVQDFIGIHKWPKVHSSLETLSGTLVAIVTVLLVLLVDLEEDGSLHFCLFISSTILSTAALLWFIIAVISLYTSKVRTLGMRRTWPFQSVTL